MSEQDENKITATFLSEKENKIKWHHSRWFWGIVVGVSIFASVFIFLPVYTSQTTFLGTIKVLSLNSGSFSVAVLMNTFFKNSNTTNIITILLYSIVTLLLLYFSFKQPKIKILYIIIFITNLILSNILAVYVLSGLY